MKPPVAVLQGNLETHPALLAWHAFRSGRQAAQRIEVLREHGATAVYRVVWAGLNAGTVIAKRVPFAKARPERTIYERVLPLVPVTAPRYHGALPGDGPEAETWLFLEDVGGERYSDEYPDHLALTARWLARLHGVAAGIAVAGALPDGGPGRYRRHLDSALERLERRLVGPDLAANDVMLLGGVVDSLSKLAGRWSDLERQCVGLPETVVHGDFRPKNVYLRPAGNRLACYPIDWETAGWGVPAADLTRIDVAAYWSAARDWCPGLSLEAVGRLAHLGQVFRTIAAIDWECAGLRFDTRRQIVRSLASLAVLRPRLTGYVQMTGVAA